MRAYGQHLSWVRVQRTKWGGRQVINDRKFHPEEKSETNSDASSFDSDEECPIPDPAELNLFQNFQGNRRFQTAWEEFCSGSKTQEDIHQLGVSCLSEVGYKYKVPYIKDIRLLEEEKSELDRLESILKLSADKKYKKYLHGKFILSWICTSYNFVDDLFILSFLFRSN